LADVEEMGEDFLTAKESCCCFLSFSAFLRFNSASSSASVNASNFSGFDEENEDDDEELGVLGFAGIAEDTGVFGLTGGTELEGEGLLLGIEGRLEGSGVDFFATAELRGLLLLF
jgi:hypothetical protein